MLPAGPRPSERRRTAGPRDREAIRYHGGNQSNHAARSSPSARRCSRAQTRSSRTPTHCSTWSGARSQSQRRASSARRSALTLCRSSSSKIAVNMGPLSPARGRLADTHASMMRPGGRGVKGIVGNQPESPLRSQSSKKSSVVYSQHRNSPEWRLARRPLRCSEASVEAVPLSWALVQRTPRMLALAVTRLSVLSCK